MLLILHQVLEEDSRQMIKTPNHIISLVCWKCRVIPHHKFTFSGLILCLFSLSASPPAPYFHTHTTEHKFFIPLSSSLILYQPSCIVYLCFPSILPWLCDFTLISSVLDDLCNLSFYAHLPYITWLNLSFMKPYLN